MPLPKCNFTLDGHRLSNIWLSSYSSLPVNTRRQISSSVTSIPAYLTAPARPSALTTYSCAGSPTIMDNRVYVGSKVEALYFPMISNCRPRIPCVNGSTAYTLITRSPVTAFNHAFSNFQPPMRTSLKENSLSLVFYSVLHVLKHWSTILLPYSFLILLWNSSRK